MEEPQLFAKRILKVQLTKSCNILRGGILSDFLYDFDRGIHIYLESICERYLGPVKAAKLAIRGMFLCRGGT